MKPAAQPETRTAPRVALAAGGEATRAEAAAVLGKRGIACELMPLDQALAADSEVVAYAPAGPITPALAASIAEAATQLARDRRPLVVLAMPARERAQQRNVLAATAFLQSAGAVLCDDPDAWIEAIAWIAGYGLPSGGRVAVVAPPGSWLEAAAAALARAASALTRAPSLSSSVAAVEPVDVVLVDAAAVADAPGKVGGAVVIPVLGRAELLEPEIRLPLIGLRPALAAAAALGNLGRRLELGLGPGTAADRDFEPDLDRFDRQLDKVGDRVGDHECKVLLASYGVPILRQAVATTPSAATRLAKRAGYPVQLKPWGPDVASERDGCPVETDLQTAADVRRGYAAVARAAGLPTGAPVIVRETPPAGREVAARFEPIESLGWIAVIDIAGATESLAAPAPLSRVDAEAITAKLVASRAGDQAPDRDALADTLVRISYLASDHADLLRELDISRIVVTPTGATVVDATARLRR